MSADRWQLTMADDLKAVIKRGILRGIERSGNAEWPLNTAYVDQQSERLVMIDGTIDLDIICDEICKALAGDCG